jgi:hypothetical protein
LHDLYYSPNIVRGSTKAKLASTCSKYGEIRNKLNILSGQPQEGENKHLQTNTEFTKMDLMGNMKLDQERAQ